MIEGQEPNFRPYPHGSEYEDKKMIEAWSKPRKLVNANMQISKRWRIKHVDGVTNVVAKGVINENNEFVGEYKFEGMTYGVTIPLFGCEVGDHDLVPILGFENSVLGDQCRQCGKEFK